MKYGTETPSADFASSCCVSKWLPSKAASALATALARPLERVTSYPVGGWRKLSYLTKATSDSISDVTGKMEPCSATSTWLTSQWPPTNVALRSQPLPLEAPQISIPPLPFRMNADERFGSASMTTCIGGDARVA